MYRKEEFRHYFLNVLKAKKNSFNNYQWYLNQIDKMLGGLDERLAADGFDGVMLWSKSQTEGPFESYPNHSRTALKAYLQFAVGATDVDQEEDEDETEDEILPSNATEVAAGVSFHLEKEMQSAVRKQLSFLEPGLVAADGGVEMSVATGRIDIVARDNNQKLVAIELKAGHCPTGAIEQVLGYAQALEDEKGEEVRAILIAASFSDRQRAAAKRTRLLNLKTYEFTMQFGTAS